MENFATGIPVEGKVPKDPLNHSMLHEIENLKGYVVSCFAPLINVTRFQVGEMSVVSRRRRQPFHASAAHVFLQVAPSFAIPMTSPYPWMPI
ncbi:hypothetical protein BN2127_JRS7_03355 [Bacillus subtilis]|nr:hypothetical protein BN2127_JRS7_03355 [Bacillus subtilis]